MEKWLETAVQWLLGPETQISSWPRRQLINQFRAAPASDTASPAVLEPSANQPTHLWPRWIFLRALGLIYFSAFYSLLFQVRGLIGPNGLLPAGDYLQAVSTSLHSQRFWFAPTLFWLGSSDRALMLVCWVGLIVSVMVIFNLWP